jgi:hypothetical protein
VHEPTTPPAGPSGVPALDAVLAEAGGRGHRHDPVLPGAGGPAGNARLTAWAGLLLLVLIAAELVTLLDVTGLMRWHVGIGILLTALALLKTGSTGWRIVRYYTGSRPFRTAGPPPMLLRVLGPLVVLATMGVLGTGFALIAIGERAAERSWFAVLGHPVSPITLHQGFFLLFAALAGLHVLARLAPAVLLASGRPRLGEPHTTVPGRRLRAAVLAAAALAGVLAVVLVVPSVNGWQHHRDEVRHRPGTGGSTFVLQR